MRKSRKKKIFMLSVIFLMILISLLILNKEEVKNIYGSIINKYSSGTTTGLYIEGDYGKLYYEIVTGTEENTVNIIGYNGNASTTNLTIPSTIDDMSVTSIGESAFEGNTVLKNIIVPSSVTSIGESGFKDSIALENILFPSGVTSIKDYTFKGCTKLQTIDLDNVSAIGREAFKKCTSLSDIDLGRVLEFGESVFEDCTELKNIGTININVLGNYAFKGCNQLDEIKILKLGDTSSIGAGVFENCTSLTSVTVAPYSTSWGGKNFDVSNNMFKGCIALTEISTYYGYVEDIGNNAFEGAENLEKINISGTIGKAAFQGCIKLNNVNMINCSEIDEEAFLNCISLSEIKISSKSIGTKAFSGCTSLQTVEMTDSVETFGENIFENCSEDLTIYGKKLSYAYYYAQENGIRFIDPSLSIKYTIEHYKENLDETYPTSPSETETKYGETGETVTATAKIYNGYTFDNTVEGTINSGTIAEDGSLVLKLYYTRNTNTPYKVEHYKENLTGTYELSETEPLSGKTGAIAGATAKQYEGFTFDNTVEGTIASGTISEDGSLVLKLYYNRNRYTIVYDSNGGTGEMTSQNAKSGEVKKLNKNTFTREGYNFKGWNSKADGTGNAYIDEQELELFIFENNTVITLYAQWEEITPKAYKVEHYQENLDGTYTLVDTDNLTAMPNTTATATAKAYEGFTYNSSIEETVASGTVAEDGSLVLKLYYKRNTYTLEYNSNGGTGTMESQIFKYGEEKSLSKNIFTREGYIFIGWNTKQDGTGTSFGDENNMSAVAFGNNETVTMYAQWKAIPTGLTAVYGQTLDNVELPEGFSWEAELTTSVGNVGTNSFTVKYTPQDDTNYNEVTGIEVTIEVSKATYDMSGVKFEDAVFVYDGTEKRIEITGELPEGVTVSYKGNTKTDIGQSLATAIFTGDSVNYNEIPEMKATLTISARQGTISNIQDLSKVYDGNRVNNPNFDREGDGDITFEWYSIKGEETTKLENAPKNSGTYKVRVIMATTENYAGTVAEKEFIISKATYDMTGVSFEDATYTYDGTEKKIEITGELPEGVKESYENNKGTNAGEYNTVAKFTGDNVNYNEIPNMTAKLTIEKANPTYTVPTNLKAEEGHTLSDVKLPNRFEWESELTTSVGEVGENTFTVKYTPLDTENYNVVTGIQVIITVTEKKSIDLGNYIEVNDKESGKKYIENIKPNTTIKQLKENIKTNGEIEVNEGKSNENAKIATGMEIKITFKNKETVTYQAVVIGDITGEGEINDADLLLLARYKVGFEREKQLVTAAKLRATDIVKDINFATDGDLLKLAKILVGLAKF